MATGHIPLKIGSATPPDNSTDNAPANVHMLKSSASAPTWHGLVADFDASTKEWLHFNAVVPPNYASGLTAKAKGYMVSAASGNVVLEGRVAAQTPGDSSSAAAKAYASANTSSATAVPGTAGHPFEVSWALTNDDSAAPGDVLWFGLARDAANGSDTATGDWRLLELELTYTTT